MDNVKVVRYIERDVLFKRIKDNSEFLSDEQINTIVDDSKMTMCDITFTLCITDSGINEKAYDNELEQEIEVKNLNYNANLFYRDLVREYVHNYYFTKVVAILTQKKERDVMQQ